MEHVLELMQWLAILLNAITGIVTTKRMNAITEPRETPE